MYFLRVSAPHAHRVTRSRRLLAGALLAWMPRFLPAQTPPDTVPTLPEVCVTVTRIPTVPSRFPGAIDVLDAGQIARGRLTLGLDEALGDLAGVHVANRYNFSLDQRLSIRGFGSRANFGLRGVTILLDGVPQTLPDGQSQLTNVDLAAIGRIEVLRGAASALYGNAAGGVLQFTSRAPEADGVTGEARVEAGMFGTRKWTGWTGYRAPGGRVRATLSASRLVTDGFRDHSATTLRQITGRIEAVAAPGWTVGAGIATADQPRAENPGALTAAELLGDRSRAAPNNVLRGADKAVEQTQVSLFGEHRAAGGTVRATVFALWRDLANPLATPPPSGIASSPAAGTFNRIDRNGAGGRIDATFPLGGGTLSFGLDLQRMRDDRTNVVSDSGAPTTTVLADQRETTSTIGPSLQWQGSLGPVIVLGGLRYDRLVFRVNDRLRSGGIDQSGRRVMGSVSATAGVDLPLTRDLDVYARIGTSFESPTSTELATLETGAIGLNRALGPQRATSVETGVRGTTLDRRVTVSLALYRTSIHDALIQARELDGRTVFRNAGRTRHQGIDLAATVRPAAALEARLAYTLADLSFRTYRVPNGTAVDTLDGHRLPGVPRHRLRLGVQWSAGGGTFTVDHTLSSGVWADDRNTLRAEDWGAGVTDLRAEWRAPRVIGGMALAPFGGILNVFDRRYISAVTVNGAGGRVFEPAPGRTAYVGATVRFGGR